jgi:hypothetical protein
MIGSTNIFGKTVINRAFVLLAMTIGGTSAIAADDSTGREYPSAVATFQRICLVPGLNPADRIAALAADSSWREDQAVTVSVPQMAISRAISTNYSFSKPVGERQWSGKLDGGDARIVVASFEGKARHRNLCALVLDGPNNAMPYADGLKAAFKAFGIGGKSVDLVHYFEFSGKIGVEKHPVRGEIFSRSLSGDSGKTTHIYVAY